MNNKKLILVWGLHTRLFHWLLVVVFSFSLITGLIADLDWMEWHMRAGYFILGLLIFRLLLGVMGRDYGRFSRLALSPAAIRAYLCSGRDKSGRRYTGHNPLGSWMVIVMLLAILVQVISGFMTTDDIFTEGPWVIWAEEEWISWASFIHSQNYWLLIGLVSLHIVAIIFYELFKKQPLVKTMVSGRKAVEDCRGSAQVTPWWLVSLNIVIAVAVTLSLIDL